jgi:hypothetical protein
VGETASAPRRLWQWRFWASPPPVRLSACPFAPLPLPCDPTGDAPCWACALRLLASTRRWESQPADHRQPQAPRESQPQMEISPIQLSMGRPLKHARPASLRSARHSCPAPNSVFPADLPSHDAQPDLGHRLLAAAAPLVTETASRRRGQQMAASSGPVLRPGGRGHLVWSTSELTRAAHDARKLRDPFPCPGERRRTLGPRCVGSSSPEPHRAA